MSLLTAVTKAAPKSGVSTGDSQVLPTLTRGEFQRKAIAQLNEVKQLRSGRFSTNDRALFLSHTDMRKWLKTNTITNIERIVKKNQKKKGTGEPEEKIPTDMVSTFTDDDENEDAYYGFLYGPRSSTCEIAEIRSIIYTHSHRAVYCPPKEQRRPITASDHENWNKQVRGRLKISSKTIDVNHRVIDRFSQTCRKFLNSWGKMRKAGMSEKEMKELEKRILEKRSKSKFRMKSKEETPKVDRSEDAVDSKKSERRKKSSSSSSSSSSSVRRPAVDSATWHDISSDKEKKSKSTRVRQRESDGKTGPEPKSPRITEPRTPPLVEAEHKNLDLGNLQNPGAKKKGIFSFVSGICGRPQVTPEVSASVEILGKNGRSKVR